MQNAFFFLLFIYSRMAVVLERSYHTCRAMLTALAASSWCPPTAALLSWTLRAVALPPATITLWRCLLLLMPVRAPRLADAQFGGACTAQGWWPGTGARLLVTSCLQLPCDLYTTAAVPLREHGPLMPLLPYR